MRAGRLGADIPPDMLIRALASKRTGRLAVCLALSCLGEAKAQLAPGSNFLGSEGKPDRVVVADFDDDGHLDLLATAPLTQRLSLHFGRGGGLFRFPLFLAVGSGLSSFLVADVDGNGEKDLVGTDPVSGELVLIHQFRGTAATYLLTRLPGEDEPSAVEALDLEPDGDLDVLVAFPGADAIGIYLNEAGVLHLPRLQGLGDGPSALRTLHPTSPGERRFLVAQGGVLSRNLIVYDGQWNSRQLLGVHPIGSIEPLAWNADALADFLLVDQSGWARVFVGGANDFAPAASWPISPGSTSASEFRAQDGRVGAAILETQHNRISIHLDAASGAPDPGWFVGAGAISLARADLDANGDDEFVVPVPEDNLLLILRRDGDGLRGYRSHRSGELPSRIRSAPASGGLPPRLYVLCPGDDSLWIYDQVGADLVPRAPLVVVEAARDFRVAHMDTDGLPDLVVLSLTEGIQIFHSSGANFAAALSVPIAGELRDVETLDLNDDQRLDLAVADQIVFGVRLLYADGLGGFTEADTLVCLDPPIALRTDDFDRDGRGDVFAVGADRRPSLFYANGNGNYQRTNWLLGNEPRGVAIGHFNADIYPDIAIGNAEDRTYSVLASLAPRFLGVTEADRAAPDGSESAAALDVNGDGLDDLVLCSSNSRSASVHLATGGGRFAPPSRVRCSSLPLDLHDFDVDGDAVADVVITDALGASVVALHVLGGTPGAWARDDSWQDVQTTPLEGLRVTPNPARGVVQLRVQSPEHAPQLRVFDLRGRLVARLHATAQGGGWYGARWDAGGVAAGRYFVQARVGHRQLVRSFTRLPE